MSTTDPRGVITYANAAFVSVSGFEREEISGQAHNIVRHPDMPQEAFADMWETLKSGRSWTALVKNRRKNGDHYWVRANATPVVRGGQLVGYMSVRTKPTRAEVDATEPVYAAFRQGRAGSRRFKQGIVVRTGLMAWTSLLQVMPVRWRLFLPMLLVAAMAVAGAAVAGLQGAALFWLGAAMAACAGVSCAFVELQVSAPLRAILAQAQAVAAGRAESSLSMNRVDEIGLIMRAINQADLNLRSLVDDVSEQVNGLHSASGEIAQGNSDLSSRTEQTAASLEQTAASMEQMSATVKNNADSARQAAQFATGASTAAAQGGTVVSEVIKTMQEISASSRKIADIIGVIDSIAFRTNILALNASVEAARAGDHGRGFAVVASEVRSLAQRSADAAREIKALINDSVSRVESGSRTVDEAGRAMQGIVDQVRRVNDLIAEISHATIEQSDGLSQVHAAVSHLDQATQQNAALVEQTAAAAAAMRSQAGKLADAVAVFDENRKARRIG